MNPLIKIALYFALGFITCLLLLMSKFSNDVKPDNDVNDVNDSLRIVNTILNGKLKELDKIIALRDIEILGLKEIKPVAKYKQARKEVLKTPCDTVSVIEFVNVCDSMNHINDRIIQAHEKKEIDLTSYIEVQKTQLKNDSSIIANNILELKETEKRHKKELRRQKAKVWAVGLIGIISTGLAILPMLK